MELTRAEELLDAWGRLSWMSLRRVLAGMVRGEGEVLGGRACEPRLGQLGLRGVGTCSALRG